MNQFSEMIKEAFMGEEPYDPSPGRVALEEAIKKFESRDRVVRFMAWFAVAFMSAVMFWSIWMLWKADSETETKMLIVYAVVFLWSSAGVGFGKMFLFSLQSNLSIMKELKRVQLALLDTQKP